MDYEIYRIFRKTFPDVRWVSNEHIYLKIGEFPFGPEGPENQMIVSVRNNTKTNISKVQVWNGNDKIFEKELQFQTIDTAKTVAEIYEIYETYFLK